VRRPNAPVRTPDLDAQTETAEANAPRYAEVAVPVRVRQTFTYRLPAALAADARVGSRLLVPFGRKLVTAYVVALHEELDPSIELDEAELKEAEELLDAEPLVTPEVLEITRWISDYYAAPWGEVLKAALPAGLNATVEQVLTATPEGRDELARLPARRAATAKAGALRLVAEGAELPLRRLARELGPGRAASVARQLERAGWITIHQRQRTASARAKRRKAVRLVTPWHAAPNDDGASRDEVTAGRDAAAKSDGATAGHDAAQSDAAAARGEAAGRNGHAAARAENRPARAQVGGQVGAQAGEQVGAQTRAGTLDGVGKLGGVGTRDGGVTLEEALRHVGALNDAQRRVVAALAACGGEMAFAELLEEAGASASSVQTLERRGVVEVFAREVRRDPLARAVLPEAGRLVLTEGQRAALSEIEAALDARAFKAFLLHGVTGSGKTEIYIRAMRAALRQGRSAMMLVPEIALTPVFSRRLRAHFGDSVAIFHSSLTTGERFDEWSRIRRGEARIIIGTRSAVFAPARDLGLIVVDEEHESSYRQAESPYYSGRDTAVVRAHKESAVVVLGSATPSLESFHNARAGKYGYLRLPARIAGRAMARAEVIDMRDVFERAGKPQALSEELLAAVSETHARGEQSIILLNRRGYSTFVICRSCGERMQCDNCDVTLTYHQRERRLVCHYCDFRQRPPAACPACKGPYIFYFGEGTEQIEEMIREQFPSLRLARLDRDTTSRRSTYEQAILRFGAGELDALVGTQMIAKGHDFHNVTLVAVVSVDAGLAMPDFRAAERTFQLITQVAGRAGRGDRPGRVLVQTYHPEHYALRHACAQNYEAFYEEEIRYRKSLSYPPFVSLAALLVRGPDATRVHEQSVALRDAIEAANSDRSCRVLGPAPAPLARLRGEHRFQLLLKSRSRARLRAVLDLGLADAAARGCDLNSVNVEIDPVNLM
jgi:primosomal protein N' (replication factor Y) (superfamily II helicase)